MTFIVDCRYLFATVKQAVHKRTPISSRISYDLYLAHVKQGKKEILLLTEMKSLSGVYCQQMARKHFESNHIKP